MFLGLALLIICGILWVEIGIITSAAALRKENLFWIQGGAAVVSLLLALLYMLFVPGSRLTGGLGWQLPGILMLVGVTNTLAFYWMGKAMKCGPNGIIWVIIQSAMAGPFLMGVLCFHDHCSAWKVLGLVLILGGILCGSFAKNEDSRKHYVLKKWLPVTLISYLLTILTQCFNMLPSYLCRDEFSTAARTLFLDFGILICGGVCFAALPPCRSGKRPLLPPLVLGIINVICTLLLFFHGADLLTKAGYGAIGYPVTVGVCIAGFELFTVFRLREKPNRYTSGSVLGILIGIILLALPI